MYARARASAVRMIVDVMEQWGTDVKYVEWDGHAEGFELPKKDLIGLVGFSLTQDHPFHDTTFGIGIMTLDDPNVARLTKYADFFYERLSAHKKFPLFNADGTVSEFEAVCFDGTGVGPMSRVDYRPTADITVNARFTRVGDWPRP